MSRLDFGLYIESLTYFPKSMVLKHGTITKQCSSVIKLPPIVVSSFQHEPNDARFHYLYLVLLEEVCDEPEMLLNEKGDSLWIEPTGRSGIKGTILNRVKGGLAVALAGHIAFLSKSLGKPTRQSFRILEMKHFQRNLRFNIVVEGMKRNSKWFRLFRESTISTLRVIEGTVLRPKGSNGYLVVIKGRHIAFLPGSRRMSKRLKTTFYIFHMNPMDREIHVEELLALRCVLSRLSRFS